MGRVTQSVKIQNSYDIAKFQDGIISKEDIRSMSLEFLVDTGAAMVCIPKKHIDTLGLQKQSERKVRTANGDVVRGIYGPAKIIIWDRDISMDIMEISDEVNAPPLLGYLALEALDLHVHPKDQMLIGNPANNGKYMLDMF